MNLIAWDKVCKPIRKGGLGLRRIRYMNKFVMAKKIWRGYNIEGEWKLIWDNKYKRQLPTLHSFLKAKDIPIGTNIWKNVTRTRDIIVKGVKWKVGKGNFIKFWEDTWLLDSPISDNPEWGKFQDQCKEKFGTTVADY